MKHEIPGHLIPADDTVVGADDDERKLNESLETDRWVYTEEPEDGLCPYCECEYERASWASRVTDAGKGVCPYVTSISDFIVQFVHATRGGSLDAKCFCGPAYKDTLITYPATPDYDIKRI